MIVVLPGPKNELGVRDIVAFLRLQQEEALVNEKAADVSACVSGVAKVGSVPSR
jgi:hypothetical protein